MKKLLFLLVMVCGITFAAKADNPPTNNVISSVSDVEDFSAPERPDCIPEGWQYDGNYSGQGGNYPSAFDVWSNNACGYREYKVYYKSDRMCISASYDKDKRELSFYLYGKKVVINF